MSQAAKLKTTDDGVDIYITSEGRFEACPGCNCDLDGYEKGGHSRYCRGQYVSRKSLAELERELRKLAAPPKPLKVIDIGSSHEPPRVVEIIGVETDRQGYTRFRSADGDLMRTWGNTMRVYSAEAMDRLQAAYDVYLEALHAYQALQIDQELLPHVTRENFRELVRQQQAES